MTTAPALSTRNRLVIEVAGLPETQGSMKAFRLTSVKDLLGRGKRAENKA